jgi:hypothetical protein
LTRSSDKSIVIINFGRSFFFFIETNEELDDELSLIVLSLFEELAIFSILFELEIFCCC